MLGELVPQRWGVGSTRLHMDVEQVALGVLLFDRIVLPTPSDVDEADRWDRLGWDTEVQARRIVQLGELVHFAPWDARLQADWRAQWERLKRVGQDSRDLAYSMTPMVIAQTAWGDVMTSAGGHYGPGVRPIPVVWSPSSRGIVRPAGHRPASRPTAPYEEVVGVRFRRILRQPARDNPDETLDAALSLANTVDFQGARRALYQAEALAAAGELTPEEFGVQLDAAVDHYNDVVTAHAGATRRRIVHHVLPAAVGGALGQTALPGAGAAGKWSTKRVVSRLLPLPPAPVPAEHAGAALALVERAMAAVWASPAAARD